MSQILGRIPEAVGKQNKMSVWLRGAMAILYVRAGCVHCDRIKAMVAGDGSGCDPALEIVDLAARKSKSVGGPPVTAVPTIQLDDGSRLVGAKAFAYAEQACRGARGGAGSRGSLLERPVVLFLLLMLLAVGAVALQRRRS